MPTLIRHVICLTVLAIAVASTPAALAGTVTDPAAADSWVNEAQPNRNFGSQSLLQASSSPEKRAYLRFDLGSLDGPVQDAVLRLYAPSAAPNGLRVYETSNDWSERRITWRNAPSLGQLVATVPGYTATNSWQTIDVSDAVDGPGSYSFVVTAPAFSGDATFASRESAQGAQLVVTTEESGAPASSSPPTVSGTARQGETLTATTGAWTGSAPISYAYQWLRCDVAGANCVAIVGATSASRVLDAEDVGRTMRVRVTATNSAGGATAESASTDVVSTELPGETEPGTVITTDRAWFCRGALSEFGELPVKVVSEMPNPGDHNAINLVGCRGDGDPATVDLILDVRGNGSDRGTGYDAVRIGQNAHDLVVTGNVECGARHPDPSIHQDVVQALSGNDIEFRDFTTGDPETGRWTCWGAGGGWFIDWSNGDMPTDIVCVRCKLATYNQNMRIQESVRSGARDSVFGYSRSYGIVIAPEAIDPVNVNNRVIRY